MEGKSEQLACPRCGVLLGETERDGQAFRCEYPDCGEVFPPVEGVSYAADPERGQLEIELRVISGDSPGTYRLSGEGPWFMGTGKQCDVHINNLSVETRHGRIKRDGPNGFRYADLSGEQPSTAETFESGQSLMVGSVKIRVWIKYSLDEKDPGDAPQLLDLPEPIQISPLQQPPDKILIGRNRKQVDVALPVRRVSREHAAIRKEQGGYYVYDLRSKIGTFVNGERVIRRRIEPNDVVSFGPCAYRFDGANLWGTSASGMHMRVHDVTYQPPSAPSPILKDVSAAVDKNQFVGIIGPSGSGKTTLLQVMASYLVPEEGDVAFDGQDICAQSLTRFRGSMAYVPQEDILHDTLTVDAEIKYAAQLRLGDILTDDRLRHCIDNAVQQVQLIDRRNVSIRELSGGQRRRVNLAVELVSRPRILFMDEPTSGLDPGTELDLMQLFRRIANQGCSVVCTTHIMENIELFDRVIALSGGRVAYCGPPEDLLGQFEAERYTQLYSMLKSGEVPDPSEEQQTPETPEPTQKETYEMVPEDDEKQGDLFRQWKILSARYGRQILSDKRFLGLLILQPIAVAWLLRAAGGEMDDMYLLFLAVVAAFWFGLSNAAREIVGEKDLVRREFMVGISPVSYVGSKSGLLACCSLIQAFLLVAVLWLFHPSGFLHIPLPFSMLDGSGDYVLFTTDGSYVTAFALLSLVSTVGAMIGLTVSAVARNVSQAIAAVPLIAIPHIAFTSKVFDIDWEWSVRGIMALFNTVECGYKWIKDVHDNSSLYCWHIGPVEINYPFIVIVLIGGLFFWLCWYVIRKRYSTL